MTRPRRRKSPNGLKTSAIGEERPSLVSVSSSTTPTPASRKSGNGWEPPSFPMTVSSAPANPTSRSSSSPSLAEPRSRIRKNSSIPAWKETCGAPSTSAKGTKSTMPPSGNSSAPQSRPIPQRAANDHPAKSKPRCPKYDKPRSAMYAGRDEYGRRTSLESGGSLHDRKAQRGGYGGIHGNRLGHCKGPDRPRPPCVRERTQAKRCRPLDQRI